MRILFGMALVSLGMAVLLWIIRRSNKNRRPDPSATTSRRGRNPKGYAIVEKDRSGVDPYPYIYVNADGSARELHPDQRDYLETRFLPADGARPYVKRSYSQRNGWGDLNGFLERSRLPQDIEVQAAPAENPTKPLTRSEQIQFLRGKGMIVTENADGSFTAQKPKHIL